MTLEIELLLQNLDEGYDQQAWHGPNLMDTLRDVTAQQADWRVRPDGHRLIEIVVHCAYWKYAGRCYLLGLPLDTFPLAGENWCELSEPTREEDWQTVLELLADQHRQLRQAISECAPERLLAKPTDSPITIGQLLRGVAAHDVYHAGQIQMIKGAHQTTS